MESVYDIVCEHESPPLAGSASIYALLQICASMRVNTRIETDENAFSIQEHISNTKWMPLLVIEPLQHLPERKATLP